LKITFQIADCASLSKNKSLSFSKIYIRFVRGKILTTKKSSGKINNHHRTTFGEIDVSLRMTQAVHLQRIKMYNKIVLVNKINVGTSVVALRLPSVIGYSSTLRNLHTTE
jgi:hypothetical protein